MAGQRLIKQGVRRRTAILHFLRGYVRKYGYAPTIQEIAEAVDLVSPNATRNHLHQLEESGFLSIAPRISRGIVLSDPAPDGWTLKARATKKKAS